jgi:hypothetical protein
MDQSKATVLAIAFFSLLAVFVTMASILILSGGKLYHKIPEKSRPRRWFVRGTLVQREATGVIAKIPDKKPCKRISDVQLI